jgi:ATP-dependent DNA ligase
MQVAAVRELQDGGAWTYEAKLDDRCLAAKRDDRVVLRSRRRNGFTARFLLRPTAARSQISRKRDAIVGT